MKLLPKIYSLCKVTLRCPLRLFLAFKTIENDDNYVAFMSLMFHHLLVPSKKQTNISKNCINSGENGQFLLDFYRNYRLKIIDKFDKSLKPIIIDIIDKIDRSSRYCALERRLRKLEKFLKHENLTSVDRNI